MVVTNKRSGSGSIFGRFFKTRKSGHKYTYRPFDGELKKLKETLLPPPPRRSIRLCHWRLFPGRVCWPSRNSARWSVWSGESRWFSFVPRAVRLWALSTTMLVLIRFIRRLNHSYWEWERECLNIKISKYLVSNWTNMSNFQPLEVGKNLNNLAGKSYWILYTHA